MLRKHFMQKKIHAHNIEYVIWHNWSVYMKNSVVTILLLFILYVVFVILSQYTDYIYLDWIFAGIWIILLFKYSIDFLNLYLDGVALSSEGITLFMREWLLEYKTEYFDWAKIVTINHYQKWLWDKLFRRWDLLINLEQGIEFPFENISSPKKQVDKIMRLREYYSRKDIDDISKELQSEHSHRWQDNMEIVMEAFSEVVKEYIDKKNNPDEINYGP